jgi:hypothetical protein
MIVERRRRGDALDRAPVAISVVPAIKDLPSKIIQSLAGVYQP